MNKEIIIIIIIESYKWLLRSAGASVTKTIPADFNNNIIVSHSPLSTWFAAGGPGGNFGHVATTDLVIPASEHESERFSTAVYDSITEQSKVTKISIDR